MKNLPDDSARAVSNGQDRLKMTPPWRQPPIENLKHTAFGLHCGVGRLAEKPPHVFVAFGRAVAGGNFRTFLSTGATPHPRGHLAAGGKRGRSRAAFANNLVRR